MFILMVTFTVYAYILPYKEKLANFIELFFQLSHLMFLLVRSTKSIVNKYLKFPGYEHIEGDTKSCQSKTDTTYLTWILLPFAYLPLCVIAGIFITKVIIAIR